MFQFYKGRPLKPPDYVERNIGPHSGPHSGPKSGVIKGGFPLFKPLYKAAPKNTLKRENKGRILGQIWGQNMESLRGFPLIYDSFMDQIRGKIWGQNFLWGSKGGSAPLKEKTAHMECNT